MLYDMSNPLDIPNISQFGKAYGTVLLNQWLPNITRTRNMFVIGSCEDFEKIKDRLPDLFTCRADARTGDPPTLRSRRTFCQKDGSCRLYKACKTE